MALPPPIVPSQYPNVPQAPGVPPVLRQFGIIQDNIALLAADAIEAIQSLINIFPQWGIFYNGFPAIVSDTLDEFSFRQEYRISTAPQEQGAFASYNKVQEPFEGRVTFYVADTPAARAGMLAQIAVAIASLDTGYALVMPEAAYTSINITHQDFRRVRQDGGVTMLAVDVWVEQVRIVGTSQFSKTVNPLSAGAINSGSPQAQTPTSQQSAAITPPT